METDLTLYLSGLPMFVAHFQLANTVGRFHDFLWLILKIKKKHTKIKSFSPLEFVNFVNLYDKGKIYALGCWPSTFKFIYSTQFNC